MNKTREEWCEEIEAVSHRVNKWHRNRDFLRVVDEITRQAKVEENTWAQEVIECHQVAPKFDSDLVHNSALRSLAMKFTARAAEINRLKEGKV